MHTREIIIISDDDRYGRIDVTREPIPSTDTTPWAGTEPARGEWEAARPGNDVPPWP
jgi:hypothetical protein